MGFEFQAQRLKHGLDHSLRTGVTTAYAAHDGTAGRRTHEVAPMLTHG